jgi:hypothetical protein
MKTFPAPWSPLLKGISIVATLLCLAVAMIPVVSGATGQLPMLLLADVAPIALLVGCALFTIRGYAITPDAILIKRLLWSTRLPRAGIESAVLAPRTMEHSIRVFGNGGLYAIAGWYRNRELGTYRAFITDTDRAIVIRYPDRTVVLSPGDPEGFIGDLLAA